MNRPDKILAWAANTFGPVALDRHERAMRFFEEAVEVTQSLGISSETVLKIVGRTYSRRAGEVAKEIGQARLTLEALCAAIGIDGDAEAGNEFNRIREIPREEWERRHNAKTALGITADSPSTPTGEA